MAIAFLCDGCGAAMVKPSIELGHVYKRQYCEVCGPSASAYIARVEALRKALVEKFKEERQELRAEFLDHVKRLPDEAEAAA